MLRFIYSFGLAVTLLALVVSNGADRKESSEPWIVAVRIIRNGQPSGSGVYLWSGLIITAAHLTATDAKMGVHISGMALPAMVVEQGSFEDIDLTLLSVDAEKLPAELPQTQLCEAPPWPDDPVIVVDADKATRSHIGSPQILPGAMRHKFTTVIGDVASTGNSGSGVFDPEHKCLLGIMSLKIFTHTAGGDKDVAKYFVPAATIRKFMAPGDAADPHAFPQHDK